MSTFNSIIFLTTVFSKIYDNIRLSVIIQEIFGTKQKEVENVKFECPEDDIFINMVEVIGTYAATKISIIFALYILNFVIRNKIMRIADFRKEFFISIEIVWFFGFQLIIQITSTLLPFIIFVQPILFYLVFKAYLLQVTQYSIKQSNSSAPDESSSLFINFLGIITHAIYLTYLVYLVTSPYEKNCGPFEGFENF